MSSSFQLRWYHLVVPVLSVFLFLSLVGNIALLVVWTKKSEGSLTKEEVNAKTRQGSEELNLRSLPFKEQIVGINGPEIVNQQFGRPFMRYSVGTNQKLTLAECRLLRQAVLNNHKILNRDPMPVRVGISKAFDNKEGKRVWYVHQTYCYFDDLGLVSYR